MNNKSETTTSYELNYLRNQPDTPTERVPFLAVARSLGDLWSYSATHNDYVVSPEPDTFWFDLDPRVHKCLILATDGLWNVVSPAECVELVRLTDRETDEIVRRGAKRRKSEGGAQPFVNPSQRLVQTAIQRCCEKMIRADNTTCITIMLDLPSSGVEQSHSYMPQQCERTLPRPVSFSHDRTLENFSRIDSGGSVLGSSLDNDNEASLAAMNLTDEDDAEANESSSGSSKDSNSDELNEDEIMSEYGTDRHDRSRRRRRRHRHRHSRHHRHGSSKTLAVAATAAADTVGLTPASSTMLIEAHSEPDLVNTPGGTDDKRSRSLTSLRRRHWSASSANRCLSSVFAQPQQPPPPPPPPLPPQLMPLMTTVNRPNINRFDGFDERTARRSSRPSNTAESNFNRFNMNEEKRVGSYIKASSSYYHGHQGTQSLKNNPNLMNHAKNVSYLGRAETTTMSAATTKSRHHYQQHQPQQHQHQQHNRHHRSNINLSQSVCSFVSSSGKHLRKSMNDLFTAAAAAMSKDEDSSKENNKDEQQQKQQKASTAATANTNGITYAKRLKRLKNTFIKTKNTLFNRKQHHTQQPEPTTNQSVVNIKRKSTSSPNLNKLNLTTAQSRFDMELDAAGNQSLIGSFRYRFLKRSRSSKLNHLNSTTLTTAAAQANTTTSTTAKRPKFY